MPETINVTLDNGQSLWFEYFCGAVVEESKRSETEVGSDNIVRHTLNGSYAQTVVTSEQIRTHSIWLRSAEGVEREVELPSHGFSVRRGHDVLVAWGAAKGQERGPYVLAVNRSTGATWRLGLVDTNQRWIVEAFGYQRSGWLLWMQWFKWTFLLVLGAGLLGATVFQRESSFASLALIMMFGPGEVIGFFIAASAIRNSINRDAARIERSIGELAARLARDDLDAATAEAKIQATG